MTLTREDADAWLTRYGQAWRQGDPALAASLFSEDCCYYETPFDAPALGRAGVLRYWQAVPEGQRDVHFGFTVLAIDGERVLAHWTASFRRASSGVQVALDGVFLLEFTEAGTCRTLREWWHRCETPPAA
jgi:hypothetical protein